MIQDEIKGMYTEFKTLMMSHKVKFLYAFGSSVTNHFNPTSSDIDLLIEIEEQDPLVRGELLLSVWDELEKAFNRKVDLLTYTSIRNPVLKKSIDTTKVLIYDGEGQKILV